MPGSIVRAWDEPAVVVSFVIVHVDPIAVDLFAEAVAGPVDELGAVAVGGDGVARRSIDLPPVKRLAALDGHLHPGDRGVAAPHDGRERVGDLGRRRAPKPRPRDVGVHGAGAGSLPQRSSSSSSLG